MSVQIKLKKGGLPGYHIRDKKQTRRDILLHLLSSGTTEYSTLIKRLNVLAIYNKNKHPELTDKLRRDMDYIRRKYKQKRSSNKKRSHRKKSGGGKDTRAKSGYEFLLKMQEREARPRGSPLKYDVEYYDLNDEGQKLLRKIRVLRQKAELFGDTISKMQEKLDSYMTMMPDAKGTWKKMWADIELNKNKLWKLDRTIDKFERDFNSFILTNDSQSNTA